MLYYLLSLFIFFLALVQNPIRWLISKNHNDEKKTKTKTKKTNLPPSPWSLPIIGHLHLLKDPLHRSLASLSRKHGPVLSLRFGSRPVLVLSTAAAVEECFTTHDLAFASRPRLLAGEYIGYSYTNVAFAPYGSQWRNLRRVMTTHLLSTRHVELSANIRAEEVGSLARALAGEPPSEWKRVELKSRFFQVVFNMISRMVMGRTYTGVDGSEEAACFREIMEESFVLSGETNVGDYVPLLRPFDLGCFQRRLRKIRAKADLYFRSLLAEHRRERGGDDQQQFMVAALTKLQDEDPTYYTDDIVSGLVLLMFGAGTDTSSVTLEWAMTLLLNHPDVLCAAQAEMDSRIDRGRVVTERDLRDLPYLRAIVREVLRLYPPAPLLLPHESTDRCVVQGYEVPRGTMLIVNAWSVHMDAEVWEEPLRFKPERFLQDGRKPLLLSFGMGRRACPGEALAMQILELTLATLLHCFDWKRVDGKVVDMEQGLGLTIPKLLPLEAMCRVRNSSYISV